MHTVFYYFFNKLYIIVYQEYHKHKSSTYIPITFDVMYYNLGKYSAALYG